MPDVDVYPEWSPDGRSIAYDRQFASADGPAGLYIIPAEGGTPRLLAAGGFSYLRFSPDSRFLSCVHGSYQLLLVDLQTGSLLEMFAGVEGPDWSPDGRSIAYRRQIDDPPESFGLHILDLDAGVDRTVFHDGKPVVGSWPAWSDDGASIAIVEGISHISIVSLDGSRLSRVADAAAHSGFSQMRRYNRRALGMRGLVFYGRTSSGTNPSFINWDGSGLQQMPPPYRAFDTYSPDGSYGVGGRLSPSDSLAVLFVFQADDITGATYRQLTSYRPPQGISTRALSQRQSPALLNLW